MRTVKNITKGNLYKNYLIYFLPLLASSLLSSLYSTIDAVIAGKCIGENALGAVSATGSVDVLLFAFFNGFSAGFAVYVAQLFGKGDFAAVKRNVVNMAVFITGVAFLFSLFAILFRGPILDYLNIDPVLRRDAELYFVIYTASYLFQYLNMVLMHALFALGVTSFSFYITLTSAVINIGGNLLTVLVFGWGVAGLAISTVVSVLAVSCIYFAVMRRAFSDLKSEKVSYRFSLRCVRESLSYTIPTALQKIAFHITGIFIAPALNGLGAEATTGYSVFSRMYHLCGSSFWNMCSAVDCHTAQAVGEGSVSKVRKGVQVGFWMNLAALTPFVVVFALFAEPIASIFFPAGFQGLALDYAVRFFRVYVLFLYFNMLAHLMHSFMRSIGKVKTVLWVTLLGSAVQIAATLLMIPHRGMDGYYCGLVSSWTVDAAVSVAIFFARYNRPWHLQAILDKAHGKKIEF